MIHELRVTPEMSVERAKKLARKLAMTGGYEVVVPSNLSQQDRDELLERWQAYRDVAETESSPSAKKASLAGRIVAQLLHIQE